MKSDQFFNTAALEGLASFKSEKMVGCHQHKLELDKFPVCEKHRLRLNKNGANLSLLVIGQRQSNNENTTKLRIMIQPYSGCRKSFCGIHTFLMPQQLRPAPQWKVSATSHRISTTQWISKSPQCHKNGDQNHFISSQLLINPRNVIG